MANSVINVSKAASCAEYFSFSKCAKVIEVSLQKDGKVCGNTALKDALGVLGMTKFDLTKCSRTPEGDLYMGYRDYTDSVAVRDSWTDEEGKRHTNEIRYTEEIRVNQKGEEYTVHVCEYDDEECAEWDGRVSKSAKEIDGLRRFTPKDVVKCFLASHEGAIRAHNNRVIEADKAAKAAKAKSKTAKKDTIIKQFNKDVRDLMEECEGMTLAVAQKAVLKIAAKAKKAVIEEYLATQPVSTQGVSLVIPAAIGA